ncbi:uncharacterized protein [Atheta coriaria]|uniref:uncharacterized protein n=1 Tax=Dalotia coriaria TaxID=877792 RepID=UPI0031F3C20A
MWAVLTVTVWVRALATPQPLQSPQQQQVQVQAQTKPLAPAANHLKIRKRSELPRDWNEWNDVDFNSNNQNQRFAYAPNSKVDFGNPLAGIAASTSFFGVNDWQKRDGGGEGGGVHPPQLMLRSPRAGRQYDVPQIECPPAPDGMERFACPTPDRQGRYHCIDDHVLCDGFIDCPSAEDEDRQSCMFYKTTKAHLDVLADALLRWARGR